MQVLDLDECYFDLPHLTEVTESLKGLFTNCAHLTELSISNSDMFDSHIQVLVDNLTPTILKVNLGRCVNLKNEHVKKLVKRCNNITHLDLNDTAITNDSVRSIIEQLKASLEDLNVYTYLTNIAFATLLELKSMPALKTLICFYPRLPQFVLGGNGEDEVDIEQVENLKQKLPHIDINEERHFLIASPFKKMNDKHLVPVFCNQWIWEIRAKEQNLFAKQDRRIDTIDFYLSRMPIGSEYLVFVSFHSLKMREKYTN